MLHVYLVHLLFLAFKAAAECQLTSADIPQLVPADIPQQL